MHAATTEEITASTYVSCVVTTRANRVEKRMKPLHVVKSKEVDIDSKELQRLQESDQSLNKIRKWIDEGKGQRSRPNGKRGSTWISRSCTENMRRLPRRDQSVQPS